MQTFLSQTAEYALRAVAWMSARDSNAPVLRRELSVGTRIPEEYLSKILRRLVLAGIFDSRKGRGGGFTFARPPGEIAFRDVLVAMDAWPVEGRCAFGMGMCSSKHPCPLHESWSELGTAFRRWAVETTFGHMAPPAPKRRARPAAATRAARRAV